MPSQATKRLVVDLPAELKDKLDRESENTGKTVKRLVMEAIDLYFNISKKK